MRCRGARCSIISDLCPVNAGFRPVRLAFRAGRPRPGARMASQYEAMQRKPCFPSYLNSEPLGKRPPDWLGAPDNRKMGVHHARPRPNIGSALAGAADGGPLTDSSASWSFNLEAGPPADLSCSSYAIPIGKTANVPRAFSGSERYPDNSCYLQMEGLAGFCYVRPAIDSECQRRRSRQVKDR
jgi:hypothetical protein